jgi:hypothetical protein
MSICEDAPCCGCCGTGVWGVNDPYTEPDPYDAYDDYEPWDGDDEEEDDDEGGWDGIPEDAAMESGLFGGDC